MSGPNVPAPDAVLEDNEHALKLLKKGLAILDQNNAPAELRARLCAVIEGLEPEES